MNTLIDSIRASVIGAGVPITTAFGEKPLIYADYTASGRALTFIEDYIRDQVLPYYANTHTETSFTGAQTMAFREQARQEVRRAVNGRSEDKVIFCGPGATAAINKLIDILGMRLPRDLATKYDLESAIPADERPVVFVGPYEHHSNELPWRESIADVVCIPLTAEGQICQDELTQKLQQFADRPLKIGSFSAASNVTGIKSDVTGITGLLKSHGALAFWDYAAAAPYVAINMNGATPIDAVFVSPHKFIGGPGTPGILIAKQSIMNNSVPAIVGGGTVVYVTPEDHRYVDNAERREEGGTPAIVESIRAGMVFKLQQEVGTDEIERREAVFVERAIKAFKQCPNLDILGNPDAPRLSIMSLRFNHAGKALHYGFVVALLNDLFGIQVRGGCSCAGPYGHALLDMDMTYSRAVEAEITQGNAVLRPGWVRLNFNYFIADAEFDYLVEAIKLVAEQGWRMLPFYHFDTNAGTWRYEKRKQPASHNLNSLNFTAYCSQPRQAEVNGGEDYTESLSDYLALARKTLHNTCPESGTSVLVLSEKAEALRWFVLPQEVQATHKQATNSAAVVSHSATS
ncbi:MAG: selenocysteine lyase/cysteine desulfurase [Candidatus Azotimanducaceae bacterium]|jgi:selenocysteine lyase/cysteine desulfurase